MEETSQLTSERYDIIAAMYVILGLSSAFLNGILLMVFLRNTSLLNSSSGLIIASLAIEDFLMGVVADPMGAYANASRLWPTDTCIIYAFITTTLAFSAMLHHTCLAVERYLTLALSHKLSNRQVLVVVISIRLFALAWSMFPLFGWSQYAPEPGHAACSVAWDRRDMSSITYVGGILFFFFFLPVLLMVYCFSHVRCVLGEMSKRALERWGPHALGTTEIIQAETKTAKMSFVMIVAFITAWTPYAVVSFVSVAGYSHKISTTAAILPAFFAKTSTLYNPIITLVVFKRYRRGVKETARSSVLLMRRVSKGASSFLGQSAGRSGSVARSSAQE